MHGLSPMLSWLRWYTCGVVMASLTRLTALHTSEVFTLLGLILLGFFWSIQSAIPALPIPPDDSLLDPGVGKMHSARIRIGYSKDIRSRNFPPTAPAPWEVYGMDRQTYHRLTQPGLRGGCKELEIDGQHSIASSYPNFSPWAEYAHMRLSAAWRKKGITSPTPPTIWFAVLNRNGALDALRLAESSGSAEVDTAALQAAMDSAPFAPFPDPSISKIWAKYKFMNAADVKSQK